MRTGKGKAWNSILEASDGRYVELKRNTGERGKNGENPVDHAELRTVNNKTEFVETSKNTPRRTGGKYRHFDFGYFSKHFFIVFGQTFFSFVYSPFDTGRVLNRN